MTLFVTTRHKSTMTALVFKRCERISEIIKDIAEEARMKLIPTKLAKRYTYKGNGDF